MEMVWVAARKIPLKTAWAIMALRKKVQVGEYPGRPVQSAWPSVASDFGA